MQVDQVTLSQLSDLSIALSSLSVQDPNLVLVFGTVDLFRQEAFFSGLSSRFPASILAGCSTAGEIASDDVYEKSCVITSLRFDQTPVKVCQVALPAAEDGRSAGKALGDALKEAGDGQALKGLFLFARGTDINGSELIDGVREGVGPGVVISGGLAGDDGAFSSTLTLSPQGISGEVVVGIGFYGDAVAIHNGSAGGWKPFGPTRRVTKAKGNILYTLDHEPALDLYKRYLGDYAKDLPASGLLFPFEMLSETAESVGLIRTILAVNEDDKSLILAGNIQQDGFVRMMHSSTDQLVLGAETAAEISVDGADLVQKNTDGNTLALLISCVGRKLVMGDRVCEEVEIVGEFLESQLKAPPVLCGFYSYGEINPHGKLSDCQLHNQTMTIAVIQEYAKR